jgi:hypothetical protein
MSTRFSLASAKNAIEWLSGDQNGRLAFSVPANSRGATESSERSHSRDTPSAVPTNARWRPSGDRANDTASAVGGVETSSRASAAGVGPRPRRHPVTPAASAVAAMIATRSCQRLLYRGEGTGATARGSKVGPYPPRGRAMTRGSAAPSVA